jgi:hypothetical protein
MIIKHVFFVATYFAYFIEGPAAQFWVNHPPPWWKFGKVSWQSYGFISLW